jgi:hypothetical protein
MPTIIVRVDTPVHGAPEITLSERVVAENLESSHYATHLIERISWAIEDAQALESQPAQSTPEGSDTRREAETSSPVTLASST